MKANTFYYGAWAVILVTVLAVTATLSSAAVMNDYCSIPPFVSQTVPPLVLLVGSKDHKFSYTAYSDSADLDEDGRIEADYKHSIDYYGYFDPVKCYTYDTSATGSTLDTATANKGFFKPVGFSTILTNNAATAYSKSKYGHEYTKFCTTGQWSGNVLNWLTMSRMDVLRKVLYGGHRSIDTSGSGYSTMLERSYIPRDAHSWAKELTGRLCRTNSPDASTPKYTSSCVTTADCDGNIGYTECDDLSTSLLGFAQAPVPTPCAANVTVTTAVNGLMLVARYNHAATGSGTVEDGATNADIITSFNPLTPIDYFTVASFSNTKLDPTLNSSPDHSNIIVTTEFQINTADASPASSTTNLGWRFVIDSDDGADATLFNVTTPTVQAVVASSYSAHPACFPTNGGPVGEPLTNAGGCSWITTTPISTTLNTTTGVGLNFPMTASPTWYRLVVRQTNDTGQSGVRLWYKKPGDSAAAAWRWFGLGSATTDPLRLTAGDFTSTQLRSYVINNANACSLKTDNFISTGQPTATAVTQQRHLFCSTTESGDNTAYGVNGNFKPGPPLLRMVKNSTLRLWDWGAKEAPVCNWDFDGVHKGTTSGTKSGDEFIVRVKTCDSSYIDLNTNFEHCKKYTDSAATPTATWKPIGLLQKYGEGQKNQKVCSRNLTKSCTADGDCTTATEGLCVPLSPMYFGLLTGSYTKNMSGGVLRKDISSITDEINQDTGVFLYNTAVSTRPTTLVQGEIIRTYERLGIVGFDVGSGGTSPGSYNSNPSYGGGCTPFVRMDAHEGQCRDWGNPLAEMMYEGLRYLSGKAGADTHYDTTDAWIGPNQAWGIPASGTTTPLLQPYGTTDGTTPDPNDATKLKRSNALYPRCSRPFMLVLSDINASYDGDMLPGSDFSSMTEDTNMPTLNFQAAALLNTIGTNEVINSTTNAVINGSQEFIGQTNNNSPSDNDDLCSIKPISGNPAIKMSLLRGLCPEEPSRRGTYYAAAVAYYGATLLPYQIDSTGVIKTSGSTQLKSGVPAVTTYSVPIASPIPALKVKLTGGNISLVPFAKSVYGAGGYDFNTSCWSKCDKKIDADGLSITNCDTTSYCGGQQIVPIYVDDVRYDTSNNLTYANFRINFEDSEQGNDHDMDSIIGYELCTAASVTAGNGSGCKVCSGTNTSSYPKRCNADADCSTGQTCVGKTLSASQVMVTMNSLSASAGIDTAIGFVVTGTTGTRTDGTTNDGVYMTVRNNMSRSPATPPISGSPTSATHPKLLNSTGTGLPLTWSKVFTASGTSTQLLHDPLWYAAKWGGFQDKNGNGKPDQKSEWAKNCTNSDITQCDPDNYYLVVNPLKLETQLDKALTDILSKTSSGTAASIVNNKGSSGANLITAVFYPQKDFGNNQNLSWVGDMQNLWYYFDPFLSNSTIREDTDGDKVLDLTKDYKLDFTFDSTQNKTVVKRSSDNGKGTYTYVDTLSNPEDVTALWSAGDKLYLRVAANRTIFFNNIHTDGTTIHGTNQPGSGSLGVLPYYASDNPSAKLQTYLQAADAASATKTIQYVYGVDDTTLRNRSVIVPGLSTTQKVWKLGDIVTSTPKVQGSSPLGGYHLDYADTTYGNFIATNSYAQRGMAYAGGNDGMLHAFNLGKVTNLSTGFLKASLSNTLPTSLGLDLGDEVWGFVPKHVLPYLKYLGDPSYNHVYTVDNTTLIEDVSIASPTSYANTHYSSCGESNYYNCVKDVSSWRTILLGGMGLGGASRASNGSCGTTTSPPTPAVGDCVMAPLTTTNYQNVGLSSYFALDITIPTSPSMMWEFPDPSNSTHSTALGTLGYTVSEPVIVRINSTSTTCNSTTPGCTKFEASAQGKNGRWFAIFTSGPTGPIVTGSHQFYGRTDQSLKIFVVDVATGNLIKAFDAGTGTGKLGLISWVNAAGSTVDYSFGGSIATNAFDTDKWDKSRSGAYSTDVVYIGYVKGKTTTVSGVTTSTFSDGGVLRLNTNDDPNPDNWELSTLIDGTGPVTASMDVIYNDTLTADPLNTSLKKPSMWLYFGTGRYLFKDALAGIDTYSDQQKLFAVKEPCYSIPATSSDDAVARKTKLDHNKDMMPNKKVDTTNGCNLSIDISKLKDQSTSPAATLATDRAGWFINLDGTNVCSSDNTKSCFTNADCTGYGTCTTTGTYASERSITTPSARTNGMVQYTTFKPTSDICGFGGETLFWFVNDETGGAASLASLKGKITIQLSTGAIVVIDLSKIKERTVGDPKTRYLEYTDANGVTQQLNFGREGRQLDVGAGKPPSPKPPADTLKKPVRQILHVQEK